VTRRTVFACPLLLLAISPYLRAGPAHGDPRLEKLFGTFIAPCCWRANLLVHSSPQADELRIRIQQLVSAGKSDEEIKAEFVRIYSLRILALPEGARGRWLTWAPAAFATAGLGLLALVLQRLRAQPSSVSAGPLPVLPDFE